MTQSFPLKYPIEFKGQTIAALDLRRPKARDLEAMETRKGGNSTKSILMLADLAGVEPDAIRELDPEDMAAINAWIEPILDPNGALSGTNSG